MSRPTVADLAEQVTELRGAVNALADVPPLVLPELPELLPLVEMTTEPVVVAPWAGVAKALVGAAVAGLGVVGTALTNGVLTPAEAVGAALAALTALAAVYRVPNADAD